MGFGQQAIYFLILWAVIVGMAVICAFPAVVIAVALGAAKSQGASIVGNTAIATAVLVVVVVTGYFIISWVFTPLLILDKGLKATAAMALSRQVVRLHFWNLVTLFMVMFGLGMLPFWR